VRTPLISCRSLVTLALSIACVALAVAWPGWLTSFRAEGGYGSPFDQPTVLGNLAISTATVQNVNLSLRMGTLRTGTTSALATADRAASADSLTLSASGKLGLFANGIGSFGEQDNTSREPRFEFHTAGLIAGADYKLTDNVILGAALGYLATRVVVNEGVGHVAIDNLNLSLFGTYYVLDTFHVDAIVTGGWNSYDQERNLSSFQPVRAHPDGYQLAVSVGGGYDFHVGALTVGPTARVNYLTLFIERYRESGAFGFTERFNSQDTESLTTDLGAQISYAISVPFGVLTPTLRIEWEHELRNNSRVITSRNVLDPGTVSLTRTNEPDRDYFNLGAGLVATFPRGKSAFVYYEAQLGRNNFTHHSLTGGFRLQFE